MRKDPTPIKPRGRVITLAEAARFSAFRGDLPMREKMRVEGNTHNQNRASPASAVRRF